MDWESTRSTLSMTQDETIRPKASWVDKETLMYRREKKLCVRCGHREHIAPDCHFLPPSRPKTRINKINLSVEEEKEILVKTRGPNS